MTKRIQRVLLTVAALAALTLAASQLANAGSGSGTTAKAAQATSHRAHAKRHRAKSQSHLRTEAGSARTGDDQETSGGKADTDNLQDPSGPDSTQETRGSEAPNGDGPGGHADEPANPNADHQFQGVE